MLHHVVHFNMLDGSTYRVFSSSSQDKMAASKPGCSTEFKVTRFDYFMHLFTETCFISCHIMVLIPVALVGMHYSKNKDHCVVMGAGSNSV